MLEEIANARFLEEACPGHPRNNKEASGPETG